MERIPRMAFLKMKRGTPRPVRQYSLVKLPVELILLIGRQVRRTQNLRNLRLVCKLFDGIFAPVVLSRIRLGMRVALPGVSLRDLTMRNESLAFVKSWTVYSLDWLVFRPAGFHEYSRAALHYLLLTSTRYLRSAKDIPPLSKEFASVQYYLKKLPECLPNLESVKWYVRTVEPKTSRILFLKFLVLLPSLKELNLSLDLYNIEDLDSFMYPLAQVSGLQKLTLFLRCSYGHPSQSNLRWFGRLIANNPNLIYLHLNSLSSITAPPLRVLCHVPVDRLTQLKHLFLDGHVITNKLKVIPHLRSLQTLYVRWTSLPNNIWETLALNGIFIPFLTVEFVCDSLCKYLLLNAGLVSFTIVGFFCPSPSNRVGSHLFRALETTNVAQITISPFNWAMWYKNAEAEACLRRCAKLRRITFIFRSLRLYEDIRAATEAVSRLGDKITLEISAHDDIHRAFKKCCQSEDPLMKSLQHRLVFLEPQN